jgi:hypothetical protein
VTKSHTRITARITCPVCASSMTPSGCSQDSCSSHDYRELPYETRTVRNRLRGAFNSIVSLFY